MRPQWIVTKTLLRHAEILDHARVDIHSLTELGNRDPLSVGVRLGDIAGAKHDLFQDLFVKNGFGAKRNGFRFWAPVAASAARTMPASGETAKGGISVVVT